MLCEWQILLFMNGVVMQDFMSTLSNLQRLPKTAFSYCPPKDNDDGHGPLLKGIHNILTLLSSLLTFCFVKLYKTKRYFRKRCVIFDWASMLRVTFLVHGICACGVKDIDKYKWSSCTYQGIHIHHWEIYLWLCDPIMCSITRAMAGSGGPIPGATPTM